MELGGAWTIEKLEVMIRCVHRQRSRGNGSDAFAGDGTVTLETPDREFRRVVDGSARLALEVKNKQFDRLVFVEQDGCQELRKLRGDYSNRSRRNRAN